MSKEKYNYREAVREDVHAHVKNYLKNKGIRVTKDNYDELYDDLYDEIFISDDVTGNASGSYTCNAWEAEENLCHNFDLLGEALENFGCPPSYIAEEGPEACDVTIRLYVFPEFLTECLEQMKQE